MSKIVSPVTAIFMANRTLENYATDDGGFLLPQQMTLWPFRAMLCGGDANASLSSPLREQGWEINNQFPGTQTRKYMSGVTRDRQGNPLASCAVVAIHNADNVVDSTATSDANGNYGIWVKNSDAYYLVGFKGGSPDVEGVTDNNVTGV